MIQYSFARVLGSFSFGFLDFPTILSLPRLQFAAAAVVIIAVDSIDKNW